MKIIVRPMLDPQREIDLTHRLVSAIAEELWRLFGGNDALNWIEAEWHLERIVAQARAESRKTAVVRVAPPEARPDRTVSRPVRSIRRERSDTGSARPSHTGARRGREAPSVEEAATWKADTPQTANAAMANA